MSRNFTPGTGDIEVAYDMWIQEYETQTWQQSQKEFKRWLDEVKADSWDHAIEHVSQLEADVGFMDHYKPHNPYRKADHDA